MLSLAAILVLAVASTEPWPPSATEEAALLRSIVDAGDDAPVPVGIWMTGSASAVWHGCTPTARHDDEPPDVGPAPSRGLPDRFVWAFGSEGSVLQVASSRLGGASTFRGTYRVIQSGATTSIVLNGRDFDPWEIRRVHEDRIDLVPKVDGRGLQTLRRCKSGPREAHSGAFNVAFDTKPEGAHVVVDGKPACTTPCTADVARGAHQVSLKLADFDDVARTIDVKEGSEPVYASLYARFGLISIACAGAPAPATEGASCGPGKFPNANLDVELAGRVQPSCAPGTVITIDGKEVGCGTWRASPGKHALHAERPLYEPNDRVADVVAGSHMEWRPTMKLMTGRLVVGDGTDGGSQVTMDGFGLGTTRLNQRVRIGKHHIRVDNDLLGSFETTVHIQRDRTTHVSGVLRNPVRWRSLTAGTFHMCGVTTDGKTRCIGAPRNGEGHPPRTDFVVVRAGQMRSCGIRADGSGACWGNGPGDRVRGMQPPAGSKWRVLTPSNYDTCGIDESGALACFGPGFRSKPVPGPFRDVVLWSERVCSLKEDGTASCAGDSQWPAAVVGHDLVNLHMVGEVACGTTTSKHVQCEKPIPWLPPQDHAVDVGGGNRHACVLLDDGAIRCFVKPDDPWSPSVATPQGTFVALAVSDERVCGIAGDGHLRCGDVDHPWTPFDFSMALERSGCLPW